MAGGNVRGGLGGTGFTPGALVVVGTALVNAVAVATVLTFVWQDRQQALASATVTTQNLARLLDEGLSAAFDKIDLALLAVKDEVDEQFAEQRSDGMALDALLARQSARAPDVTALRVVDRDGAVTHSSSPTGGPVSLADRDFFIRTRAGAELAISQPLAGRITRGPIMVFARRLAAPDGTFAGMAIGTVDLNHVASKLARLDVGAHGVVVLRNEEMQAVARTGPGGSTGVLDPSAVSSELRALVAAGSTSGTYQALAPSDNTLRTLTFRHLDHHPFYIIVGLAHEDRLADWRREATVAGALLAAFALLTSFGMVLARRAWRQQLKAEEGLAAEREWLAVTLRSIGDGDIATDLDERVLFLNSVAARLTGWSPEEATGRPVTEIYRLLDRRTRSPAGSPVARALESSGGADLPGRLVLVARDGREFNVVEVGSPIRDRASAVVGAVLVFRDITTQERSEEELARVQKVESLAVLAGGIAHDFNNLLTAIAGNVSIARELIAAGSGAAEPLADAEAASMRARGLTHQLLTFSRGGAPLKRRVDLSALVEEAARFAAHGVGTALRFETTPDLLVEVDPGQVGQVVQNLVLNGIQAMGSTGTLLVRTGQLTLPAANSGGLAPGRYALLTVVDAGPGVPPELMGRIFDPFFTTKEKGTGLGLAISHSIVLKHGGHIEVASAPGAGAAFRVYLPSGGEAVAQAQESLPGATPQASAAHRILIMDDEEAVRHLAGRLLGPLGCEVVGARDGDEAVILYAASQAAGRPFSAVIMDLTIPGGMGGLEALGRIREIDPDVVAIVSSGYSNDPVMAHWSDHGFRGHLAKPYIASELRETLRSVLRL